MQARPVHPRATGDPVGVARTPAALARRPIRQALVGLSLVVSFVVSSLVAGAAPTLAARPTQAERVATAVASHIGARYVWGSTGPRTFDCSGLVFRAFKEAGLAKRIGGFDTAHGYYNHFRRLGRVSRVAPRVGDIVVYDGGGHVGIYVGRGAVVSALLSGVKRHPIRGLNIRFTGILRVDLTRGASRVVPAASKRAGHRRVVIADRKLPLRARPGRGSASLAVVRKGSHLRVFGSRTRHGTTWVKVRLDGGRRGWVNQAMTSAR